jgi:hypothetical protein
MRFELLIFLRRKCEQVVNVINLYLISVVETISTPIMKCHTLSQTIGPYTFFSIGRIQVEKSARRLKVNYILGIRLKGLKAFLEGCII